MFPMVFLFFSYLWCFPIFVRSPEMFSIMFLCVFVLDVWFKCSFFVFLLMSFFLNGVVSFF